MRARPSDSQLAQRNSRRCQRSSSARPCDWLKTMPARWKNLSPLYLGGLCDAEIWMPPAAWSSRTRTPMVGVAVAPVKRTSWPVAVTPASTAAAKSRGRDPPIVTDHDRTRLALAGVGRRELDGDRRVESVAHDASKTRDAGDPRSAAAHRLGLSRIVASCELLVASESTLGPSSLPTAYCPQLRVERHDRARAHATVLFSLRAMESSKGRPVRLALVRGQRLRSWVRASRPRRASSVSATGGRGLQGNQLFVAMPPAVQRRQNLTASSCLMKAFPI